MCLAVLAVSGTCLWVIQHNVQKGRMGWVWKTAPAPVPIQALARAPSPPSGLSTMPGESFYIEILALFFSVMAVIFGYHCSPGSIEFSEDPEDRERECLIAEAGPDADEWSD